MKTSAKFWDGIAEKYARNPISDMDAYEYTLRRTRSYLTLTDRVLELGCGTASTALRLADAVADYLASDISDGMLAQGELRLKEAEVGNITLAQATAATAPEGPFDVVMGFNLFHLIDPAEEPLAQVHKRLKSGGLFISKTPCIGQSMKSFKFRMIKFALPLLQLIGKAPFVRFLSVADWEREVTEAGFEIIESGNFPVDPASRYLVARRL